MGLYVFSLILFFLQVFGDQNKTEFVFWNVGQGDMMTLITPHECMFFDVGGSHGTTEFQKKYIKLNCYHKSNFLFISHFDLDHIKNYKTMHNLVFFKKIYSPHLLPKTQAGKNFLNYFNKQNIEIEKLPSQSKLNTKGISITFLPHTFSQNENSKSMVLLIKINNKKILLTGDLPSKYESQLKLNAAVDILKVAHHGSKNSTTNELLYKIKPKTCILSVGKNTYGHPHAKVKKKLRNVRCAALRTDALGNIKLYF